MLMVLSACLLQSCVWWYDDPITDGGGESLYYEAHLCFADAQTGSDLVKGIQLASWSPKDKSRGEAEAGLVSADCYDLEVVLTNRHDVDSLNYKHPELMFRAGCSSYDELYATIVLKSNYCPVQDELVYRLRCPHLFGDEDIHQLQIDWKEDKDCNLYNARQYYCSGGTSSDPRIAKVEATDGTVLVWVRR